MEAAVEAAGLDRRAGTHALRVQAIIDRGHVDMLAAVGTGNETNIKRAAVALSRALSRVNKTARHHRQMDNSKKRRLQGRASEGGATKKSKTSKRPPVGARVAIARRDARRGASWSPCPPRAKANTYAAGESQAPGHGGGGSADAGPGARAREGARVGAGSR